MWHIHWIVRIDSSKSQQIYTSRTPQTVEHSYWSKIGHATGYLLTLFHSNTGGEVTRVVLSNGSPNGLSLENIYSNHGIFGHPLRTWNYFL